MSFPFSLNEFTKGFLKNDILSIDIGFTNIKIVHARQKSGNMLKVLDFGIAGTPEGCIKNGIISNVELIGNNLKRIITEHGITEKNVKLVISAGSNVISKIIFIEEIPGKKIEEIIRREIAIRIPVNMHEQKLFYRIINNKEANDKSCIKVLVTVVPNYVIDNYIRLVSFLKFKPMAIEIPFSSVARFFCNGTKVFEKVGWHYSSKMVEVGNTTAAIVDLGSETTNLSILNNGSLEFNRVILTGGRSLDEIIAKKLGINRDTAERYKKMHGIADKLSIGDDVERAVDECVREHMKEILYNIKRSMDFYVERCGGGTVEMVFFIGGGSALKGLKKFAGEVIGLPVYTIEMMSFKNIEFEENLDKDKIRFLINALGISM
jgi:type IV pilus assembly protein PilM